MKALFLLASASAILSCCTLRAAPPTTGQFEVRVKRADAGFDAYGVTLSNGQVIGKSAGVPAAVTVASDWADITSKPTTLAGYGITDPIVLTSGSYSNPAWITALAWSKISGTPTTLSGYGITDPIVLTSGTYSNPAWITALAWSKISGTPTTLSGYGITDASPIAGSTAIVTVGTIGAGTWQGSIIAPAYLGTGSSISTKFLRGDGTWQAVDLSGYQSLAGALALGGFSSITGTLPVANGGTGITSLGTGVAPFLGTPSKANANEMLSDDNFAFVGAANTFSDVQTVKSLRLNASDGAYLRDGYEATGDAAQKGRLTWGSDAYGVSVLLYGAIVTLGPLQAGTGVTSPYYAGAFVIPASHQFDFRSGTNATKLSIFNTYTDTSNFEAFAIDLQAAANVASVGTTKGASGGTARDWRLVHGGVEKARVASGGFTIGSGGTPISKVLSNSASLDFPSMDEGEMEALTITVTGAEEGDVVLLGLPAPTTTYTVYQARVSAPDTVYIEAHHTGSGGVGPEDPAEAVFTATIIKH